MTYTAPLREQMFVLETVADLPGIAALPGFEGATPDLVGAVLAESARLMAGEFAPLNSVGDKVGARAVDGVVTMPEGFRDAYASWIAGGWAGLNAAPAHGGQGLPFVLSCAVMEQLMSANMAFSLCMMLSAGAIEALQAHASPEQQRLYLEKLVSGEWTGTMNLTEPQAGSDVGALRTLAVPHADGSWRIKGQKIYITWGEHDLADNIIHLVLARTPDAPPGTKGISLFIVPKFLVNADGSLGARNDVRAIATEHKLGIHASPTCTMSFGDRDDCVGFMVGAEGGGMRAMFTMMNHARINVGLQGLAVAERAYQHALDYARTRVQSAKFGGGRAPVRIIEHADVRRMLMTMKANIEAARAITYLTAASVDRGHAGDAEAARLADLLTPVTKAFATDVGVEMTSLAVQVFGGMGYVEETGAAQHLRDARIAPIYEGTNGIQALDLVGRKLGQGRWQGLFADIRADLAGLPKGGDLGAMAPYLDDALAALQTATVWMSGNDGAALEDTAAAATPYLRMFALTVGGWLLIRQAAAASGQLAAAQGDPDFLRAKVATARFFAEQLLPAAPALLGPITRGALSLYAVPEEQLLAR
ncbi:acyl-CoA dehydrogenase [Sandaracinobacteroides saxicola]|uniref:3-methylmercaptopropionyl-CoA dehydrogenase n=1 Tax=Sandaracinobacteroides saxicola TaxID=2759707 RepID=A0A7G5IFI8_9SPHN|nr:acyl-CoA dehydrogenase [Sandaracinobacteroides saxicola]QMW22130.1 acyl-CoA dehydrogenase [Sandaracinobacteroides saxicola]